MEESLRASLAKVRQAKRAAQTESGASFKPRKKQKRRRQSQHVTRKNSGQKAPVLSGNEMLEKFNQWKNSQSEALLSRLFDPSLPDISRAELFDSMPLDTLIEKYAWAIPDDRALRIIESFAPIVEVGAGRGYWARLLRDRGVDIVALDSKPGKKVWTRVEEGGPENLPKHSNRTLFLCYPDDFQYSDESMALKCLEEYPGKTVIVVGEAFGVTKLENPWGKSIAPEAQQTLSSLFHKLLQVSIPSFPSSADLLSVWRRTERCDVDELSFANIPSSELLPTDIACPSLRRFL